MARRRTPYPALARRAHRLLATLPALAILVACGSWASPAFAGESKPFEVNATFATTGPPIEVFEDGGRVRRFENPVQSYTQAGGHPYALTTTLEVSSEVVSHEHSGHPEFGPTQDPKDIVVGLPPGLVGDPQAVPECPLAQVLVKAEPCPAGTQVGEFALKVGKHEYIGPIVNLTPEAGQSAEFGLVTAVNLTYLLTAHLVRSENPATKRREYGLSVASNEIPLIALYRAELTFWGTPADHSHDLQRGLRCVQKGTEAATECTGGDESSGVAEVPFLTLPTDCTGEPGRFEVSADSWENPRAFVKSEAFLPPVTGCDLIRFGAETEVRAEPSTLLADAPVEFGVELKIPQPQIPGGVAGPQLRETTVTLPEGMSVNPSIVDGIRACEARGPEGINIEGPEAERPGVNGEPELAPGHCPQASIVGSAEAVSPLLGVPVRGQVYLAKPECGGPSEAPCTEQDALDGKLYKLYLELGGTGEFANTGIEFKVPIDVRVDPATGQLTSVVNEIMQAPVNDVKIRLDGEPRSALANPAACTRATTTADLRPWSAPKTTEQGFLVGGTPDALLSSFFDVAGCSSPPSFAPKVLAGTTLPVAGQFSTFTINILREDREQYVKSVQVHTPPGLLGMLSNVSLCDEAQASAGTCAEASRIGTTRVASGAGPHPFELEGAVYLTGPYRGAPFGLSIVVPIVAGPFNLGTKVVRARIQVDPTDSSLLVTADETGPFAVPQIVFGVPVRLKRITVNIDRPDFMFNPTNCSSHAITTTVSGSQQAIVAVSNPFTVAGCRNLAFKPSFNVSTAAHTSKKNGASLDVKLAYPANALGHDANIAAVRVELPKALPSRLTTLQKACPAATFQTNPAACPAPSIIGTVRARTPVLPVELSGPVYFVSHGGEAFPSLVVVLQGDGVRVDLIGTTFISKAGVTSSTFKTVPDVPVDSFELYLPQGPYSALTANGNLCSLTGTKTVKRRVAVRVHGRKVYRTTVTHTKQSLVMPTRFVAQNGEVFQQNTQIAVDGCATPRAAKPKRSQHRKGRK